MRRVRRHAIAHSRARTRAHRNAWRAVHGDAHVGTVIALTRTAQRQPLLVRVPLCDVHLLFTRVDLSFRDRPFRPNVCLIICIDYAGRAAAACVRSFRQLVFARDCRQEIVSVWMHQFSGWSYVSGKRHPARDQRQRPVTLVTVTCTEAPPKQTAGRPDRRPSRNLRCHRLCSRHV